MSAIQSVSGTPENLNTTSSVGTQSASEESVNFSELLTQALRQELKEQSMAMTASLDGSDSLTGLYGLNSGLGIESIMLSSAASGEIGESEIALFLMYMMMQCMGEGSDSSMLLSLMSVMLGQMENGSSGTGSGGTLSSAVPSLSGTDSAELPAQSWLPASPSVVSSESDRSAELYQKVIDQFNVESAERYRAYRYGDDTYCNIYLWDVTSAMGCEIPHYVDSSTGLAKSYPDVSGAYELDANGVCDWMARYGELYGWREVSAQEAQAYANGGRPAVTAWKNASGAGHVQVVCPSADGGFDSTRGAAVAQAGGTNSNYTYISDVFGVNARQNVKYYVHE